MLLVYGLMVQRPSRATIFALEKPELGSSVSASTASGNHTAAAISLPRVDTTRVNVCIASRHGSMRTPITQLRAEVRIRSREDACALIMSPGLSTDVTDLSSPAISL